MAEAADFLLVTEFCEIKGPKPLLTIPLQTRSRFNHDEFAVRIMSVDHQPEASGRFRLMDDSQMSLSEPKLAAYAYVHQFTLYDINARGYVRPYAIAYVTQDENKIMTYFDSLLEDISKVTAQLKFGNAILFLTELQHRRDDLLHTKDMLVNAKVKEGKVEDEQDDSQTETIHKMMTSIDQMIEVVVPATNDTKLDRKKALLESKLRKAKANSQQNLSFQATRTRALTLIENRQNRSFVRPRTNSLDDDEIDDGITTPYTPQFINLKKNRDFTATMKTLQELTGVFYEPCFKKLESTLKHYNRENVVLCAEVDEAALLKPKSSLLTIGRTVVLNFYLCPTTVANNLEAPSLAAPRGESPKAKKRLFDVDEYRSDESCDTDDSTTSRPVEWFDPDYLLSSSPKSHSMFADALDDLEFGPDDVFGDGNESVYSFATDLEPGEMSTPWPKFTRTLSNGTIDSMEFGDTGRKFTQMFAPRRSNYPFQSSSDHVYHPSHLKPGTDVIGFLRSFPTFVVHIVFALLRGRPVVVLGIPESESLVRSIVKTLWLFVPGHSVRQQAVAWRSSPLKLHDLASLKLVGMSKKLHNAVPHCIERYVSVFDIDTKVLRTPKYAGKFLEDLSTLSIDDERLFLAHVHTTFLQLATKSFLYYHLFCLKSQAGMASTKKTTKEQFLQQIDVTASDQSIVVYLADVVMQQQQDDYLLSTGHGKEIGMSIQLDHSECTVMKPPPAQQRSQPLPRLPSPLKQTHRPSSSNQKHH